MPEGAKMPQSRKSSLIESSVNTAIGYGVALTTQMIVFPMYGIQVSATTNLIITAWFSIASLARSYLLRRFFNNLTSRWFHN